MGMDIYGLHPTGTATSRGDAAQAASGEYFRASAWAWAPIHVLCTIVIEASGLPISTKDWSLNDGAGLRSQEECDLLADALDAHLKQFPLAQHQMSIDLGMYTDASGRILTTAEAEDRTRDVQSAHTVTEEHLRQWIAFLRACGGFEIC